MISRKVPAQWTGINPVKHFPRILMSSCNSLTAGEYHDILWRWCAKGSPATSNATSDLLQRTPQKYTSLHYYLNPCPRRTPEVSRKQKGGLPSLIMVLKRCSKYCIYVQESRQYDESNDPLESFCRGFCNTVGVLLSTSAELSSTEMRRPLWRSIVCEKGSSSLN